MTPATPSESDRFDGLNPPCHNFLARLRIQFALEPSRFGDEETKVMYLFSQLTGRAFDWAVAAMKEKRPLLQDFELAADSLETTFERPDRRRTAAIRLRGLSQGKDSVEEYADKFKDLATWAGWDETALIDQFVFGLKEQLQDLLASMELPTTLFETFTLATRLDLRITCRENAKASNHSAPVEAVAAQQTQQHRAPAPSTKEKPQPNDGYCFYCKKAGHLIAQCRKKAAKEGLKEKGQSSNQ
jgi:retrotransposon gag protein